MSAVLETGQARSVAAIDPGFVVGSGSLAMFREGLLTQSQEWI